MGNRRKHTKLIQRKIGHFAPNEISILGSSDSVINDLIYKIAKNLKPSIKLAFLNASSINEETSTKCDVFIFDLQGDLSKQSNSKIKSYNNKFLFSKYDLLFINGNHNRGEQQILILDKEKESSVLKQIDQLDNIQFIIKLTENESYFDFLIEKYPHIKNLRSYLISDINKISNHIENIILQQIPKIQGLILTGGKSIRMGKDKGLLEYHGKSQRIFAMDMLEKMNFNTYLSVRKEQEIKNRNTIEDTFLELGPFGAICSAFQHDPNSAWLVLANDLPFVDENIIQLLLQKRDPSKIATTIKGKSKDFPEPLITIWEPKAYPILLNYLSHGIPYPIKVLINSDVEIVEIDDNLITNVNTPEEFELAKKKLNE